MYVQYTQFSPRRSVTRVRDGTARSLDLDEPVNRRAARDARPHTAHRSTRGTGAGHAESVTSISASGLAPSSRASTSAPAHQMSTAGRRAAVCSLSAAARWSDDKGDGRRCRSGRRAGAVAT